MSSIVGATAKMLVIAHRGASALRPEHTLAAYARAIEDGADFIEPDLVMTRDGVLVARHEDELEPLDRCRGRAPNLPARRTIETDRWRAVEGWFCEDFSLQNCTRCAHVNRCPTCAAARTMACMRFRPSMRSSSSPPTNLDGVGRSIGIIPELKNSSWFHSTGLDPERRSWLPSARHAYLRGRRSESSPSKSAIWKSAPENS